MPELSLLWGEKTKIADWPGTKIPNLTHTKINSTTDFIRNLSVCPKSDSGVHKEQKNR